MWCVGMVACVLLGVWFLQGSGKVSGEERSADLFDSNAALTKEKYLTEEEISEKLQKEADISRFRFQMNGRPFFEEEGAEGDWCIINSSENSHHMVVVVKDVEGKVLYQSRELRPGEQEMSGVLRGKVNKGENRAVATVLMIDPVSGVVAGSIETDLVLVVKAAKEEDPGAAVVKAAKEEEMDS